MKIYRNNRKKTDIRYVYVFDKKSKKYIVYAEYGRFNAKIEIKDIKKLEKNKDIVRCTEIEAINYTDRKQFTLGWYDFIFYQDEIKAGCKYVPLEVIKKFIKTGLTWYTHTDHRYYTYKNSCAIFRRKNFISFLKRYNGFYGTDYKLLKEL